jgi:hypothetical protein
MRKEFHTAKYYYLSSKYYYLSYVQGGIKKGYLVQITLFRISKELKNEWT